MFEISADLADGRPLEHRSEVMDVTEAALPEDARRQSAALPTSAVHDHGPLSRSYVVQPKRQLLERHVEGARYVLAPKFVRGAYVEEDGSACDEIARCSPVR
jgi:hypothetical protein